MLLRLIILFFLIYMGPACAEEEKRITITIDDVPMPGTKLFTGTERTNIIIKTLKKTKVDRVGIFVLGENITKDNGKKRLQMYDDAGHMIGNHTYSHPSCTKVSQDFFKKDIDRCHEVIKQYQNFNPFFRYPYLDKCGSLTKKRKIDSYLKEQGYKSGYVTVVTLDYYVNSLLQKALKSDKKVDYEKLKNIYLETTLEYVEFEHELAKKVLGYYPAQVLLLHENDINALYLEEMIDLLRSNGWSIISPEEAYKNSEAEVLSSIAAIRKRQPHIPVATKSFSTDYIKDLIQKEKVFTER